jgi:hypothetical protein
MATDASRVINNLGPLYWVGFLWHWKIPTWLILGEANYIILKKKLVRKIRGLSLECCNLFAAFG